jgi:pimeloyl-ACP methyl ester carboxylesterase
MFKDHYLNIDGAKIRYFDEGKGPVVILVHGLGGSAVNWKKNIRPLAKKFRVIALDLPSFGKSEMPKVDWDKTIYDLMVAFLKKFLRALGLKRFVLVGESMGGGVVTAFALKYPGMVEKLVIVDGASFGREVSLYRLLALPIINRIMMWLTSQEAIARRLATLVVQDTSTLDDESFYAYIHWQGKPEIQEITTRVGPRALSLAGQQWLFIDRLKELRLPTLVIWGKNDRLVPLKHGLRAHRLIKGSKLAVFDHCGHVPNMEKPEEFNKVLFKFLTGK